VPGRSILLSVLADRIYVLDPETGAVQTLVEGLTDYQGGFATWAPDHDRFAYGDGGIVIVDANKGSGTTLVAHQGLSMPAWSPDGLSLAYGDGRNLWVTPVDHLQARYLAMPLTLGPLSMAWQPSGSIAFEGLELVCHIPKGCSSTDGREVWTILPDGTGLTRLTHLGHAGGPKWSPDGRRLLFIRYLGGGEAQGELWVVNADGSGARRLTDGSDIVAADWSPHGTQMAIVRRGAPAGELRLWLADENGQHARSIGPAFAGTSATVDW